jgi:predicted amidohydrolase
MRSEKGAINDNLKAISGFIAQADKKGVEIIGLPESSITGYNNPLKYPKAIISTDGPEVDALLRMTKGRKPTVLAGLIEKNSKGAPFLTQIAVQDGRMIGRYRKHIVFGLDDTDNDWFSAGNEIRFFNYGDLKYGLAICADIAYEDLFAEYAKQGVQIVFEMAAPGLYGEQATRDWESGYKWWEGECQKHFEKYAKKYRIWIAVATAAGRTIDEDFPGGGYLFSPDGQRVYTTKNWNPCEVSLELDLKSGMVREI